MQQLAAVCLITNNSHALETANTVYETRRRVLGPEHRDTLLSMLVLSGACLSRREFHRAESLARRAYETALRKLGENHDTTVAAGRLLKTVTAVRPANRKEQIAKLLDEASKSFTSSEYSSLPELTSRTVMQGTPLLVAGKWEQAAEVFRHGVDLMRRAGAEDANLLRGLTTAYRNQGKYAEAEPYMVDLVALERRAPGDADRQARADMGALAQVYVQ
jgi:hypothetical protein